jgi:hypothetical protein
VIRRVAALSLLWLVVVASGCGKDSPTAPTPPPSPTRTILLEANLGFGNVEIGSSVTRELRIINTGTDTLTITGMNSPGAGAGGVFVASWTSGSIAPGASQVSVLRFTPTAAQAYGGTLTVNGNQTSGTNTIAISGTGVFPPRPPFARSGSGNTVFDMPPNVTRLLIRGHWTGRDTSNFIVRVDGRLVVNEVLRTSINYEGIHAVSGTTVEITNSSAIEWSFQEIQ